MNRYDDSSTMQIRLRWSPNTFKGFAVAMSIATVATFVSMCTKIEPPEPYVPPSSTTVMLSFGEGDGTGGRKGNLQKEGAAHKGREATNPLQDATRSASSRVNRTTSDPTQTTRMVAVRDVGKKNNKNDGVDNTAEDDIGLLTGKDNNPGTGWAGSGTGKGLGYDAIDWGGGGNRIVLNKQLPKFPPGTLNTEVKLKFLVRPDGSVSRVVLLRRGGNPAVDQAAERAMYQWRFNPKADMTTEMEGTITFVFKNS